MLPREVIRQIRRLQIRARRAVEDLVGGEYHSVFKGMGLAFDEVRAYQPGDDIRTIDWNVTARMGHPFIKRYIEERELTVMLVIDCSASHHFGTQVQQKREVMAELAAVLAIRARRRFRTWDSSSWKMQSPVNDCSWLPEAVGCGRRLRKPPSDGGKTCYSCSTRPGRTSLKLLPTADIWTP